MSIVKLSPAEVLAFACSQVPDAIYELTPMGLNEYFVHIYPNSGGLAPFSDEGVEYGQVQRYAVPDADGPLRRFGRPADEHLYRISYRSQSQDFLITHLQYEKRHRYDIGGPLLAMIRSVNDGEGAALMRAALGCKVASDKSYQPAEILDVLHRMHAARFPELLSNSHVFMDLDDDTVIIGGVDHFPFDKSQDA